VSGRSAACPAESMRMPVKDQRWHRRQCEEKLKIKESLESEAQRSRMGDFPGPEAPMVHKQTAVG
jgi:hypothetical protein